jgi:hypothetical protein
VSFAKSTLTLVAASPVDPPTLLGRRSLREFELPC